MIPLYCSFIRRKDMDTVLSCLVTDSVGPGDYTEKFVKNAREVFGFDTAIAVRSPYLALFLALERLGLAKDSAIGLSPLAPAYQAGLVSSMGYKPVFIDHDADTALPEIETVRAQGCAAYILFEPFGILPEKALLDELGIPVIEDASQSLDAQREGIRAGTLGNFALCGLEQGSPVTSGGGALLFTAHKRDASVLKNCAESLGGELLLTDYNAALGLAQLRNLEKSIERRRELEASYRMELARTRHHGFDQPGEGRTGLWSFAVILESGMKDAIIHAKRNGIEAAPAFEGSVVMGQGFPESTCPGARSLAMRCLLFPLHEKISSKDAGTIAKVLATLP
ncbi:MAG: DegT/DnrJ/EryC1/StrS family aminotransferase [bacterium]|mgnify:CR=1 FL=1|jgi:dTDP-4-amino-4,6-dideoxygalactose transaminase|nr:putative DegT/DnrJ/EryC1/StrS aminotransferase [uncultured Spirochaetota bacterium]HOI23848.1 DegT/DnrJ/EryC1/StrS family aminotransferase [Spirochaetales bacterium]